MKAVVVKDESLAELLAPLHEPQRDYLLLRLGGLSVVKALNIVSKTAKTLGDWEWADDKFKALERYLIANSAKYAEEAVTEYISNIGIMSLRYIYTMLKKQDYMSELSETEKRLVHRCAEIGARLKIPSANLDGGSYDEMVLRRVRKVAEITEG